MLRLLSAAAAAAAASALVPSAWCTTGAPAAWPICNPAAAIDTRAADIVSRISLSDKIQALNTGTPALNSIGLPQYNW